MRNNSTPCIVRTWILYSDGESNPDYKDENLASWPLDDPSMYLLGEWDSNPWPPASKAGKQPDRYLSYSVAMLLFIIKLRVPLELIPCFFIISLYSIPFCLSFKISLWLCFGLLALTLLASLSISIWFCDWVPISILYQLLSDGSPFLTYVNKKAPDFSEALLFVSWLIVILSIHHFHTQQNLRSFSAVLVQVYVSVVFSLFYATTFDFDFHCTLGVLLWILALLLSAYRTL